MKALAKLKAGYGHMSLIDMEEPDFNEDQVKIKVKYSGICGSDIHTFKGEYNKNPNVPLVLGHEFSGEVVGVGKKVKGIKVGDYVTSETTFYVCEECDYCKTKDYNLCSSRKGLGTQVNGSFAEYVVARGESVHVLPDGVDCLSAALTEPLACCVHGVIEKLNVSKGEKVLVIGPGPIGLLSAMVAKACGAYVIISGTRDSDRLKTAVNLGIDKVVNVNKQDLKEIVSEITNGYGVDKIIECSGSINALNDGFNLLKKTGSIVQIGLFKETFNEINMEKLIHKEIALVGSRTQKPSSWELALKLLAEKKVDAKSLVTDIYSLDQWEDAFDKMIKGGGIKIVLKS